MAVVSSNQSGAPRALPGAKVLRPLGHLLAWVVWQSAGVSLLPDVSDSGRLARPHRILIVSGTHTDDRGARSGDRL
jgi:hypothetical protein